MSIVQQLFFGPIAVAGWFLASSVLMAFAVYIWAIVLRLGGLRGTALAILFTALAIVCCCFGLILSRQTWIPGFVLGSIITSAFAPIVICAFVLTDFYGASRNEHLALTARLNNWWESVRRKSAKEGNDARYPIEIHENV